MESISSKLYGAIVDNGLKWREGVGAPKDKMIRTPKVEMIRNPKVNSGLLEF
jgi:hypothetical protein